MIYNDYIDLCHHGNKLTFVTDDGIMFYGGGLNRDLDINDNVDLIISLDTYLSFILLENNKTFLAIQWQDYDIPNLSLSNWISIKKLIDSLKAKKVLVCCIGGHGRTGTCLAILAYLYGISNNPIEYIRSNYCYNAIENLKQEYYIQKIIKELRK